MLTLFVVHHGPSPAFPVEPFILQTLEAATQNDSRLAHMPIRS